MIARPILAYLHKCNRDRRVVGAVAVAIAIGFRCLPPILWGRMRWAQGLEIRAREAASISEGAMLRRIFDQPEVDYMPWRLSDLLGWTERRRTALGKIWHAEYEAERWPRMVRYLRERYGIKDDVEATDDA